MQEITCPTCRSRAVMVHAPVNGPSDNQAWYCRWCVPRRLVCLACYTDHTYKDHFKALYPGLPHPDTETKP